MINRRIGLGPVFVYEWITASRRWQTYAPRSMFVSVLLIVLLTLWLNIGGLVDRPSATWQFSEGVFSWE